MRNETATRRSLIDRLANWEDQKNWHEFFQTYWKLIYGVARRAGLGDDEAQEVVQETLITVAKNAPAFKYDPAVGSFKGWLLNITRWRIADQFRRRSGAAQKRRSSDDSRRTATIARIPDPAGFELETVWDEEWRKNILASAVARVKRSADARQFQIFDCYALKNWPVKKVAATLGVSVAQVYLAKHRIGALLKKQILALEKSGGIESHGPGR